MAELKPVYLIAGADRPKIRTALDRLRGHFDAEAIETVSAERTSGADAVALCNSLGLFGGELRLVIVEDVDGHRGGEGRMVGGWKAADVKAVEEYLAAAPPDTVLALVAEEAKRDSPLAKAVAKAGDILTFDIAKRDLPKWVAAQFQKLGHRVDPAACRLLVEIVGEDADELESEIEKIATWAGDRQEIGEREIELLAAAVAEASAFALTDSWGRRDVGAVLTAAETTFERSGEPRRNVPPQLAGRLAAHVARVRQCQAWEAEGVSAKDAAARLRKHPLYVQKLYGQAGNFDADELREVVVRLAELDHALKGASRLAPDLELERALVDATRRAG